MTNCPHCQAATEKLVVSCPNCDQPLEFGLLGPAPKPVEARDVIPAEGVVPEPARQHLTRLMEEGRFEQAEESIKAMLQQARGQSQARWRTAEVLSHYAQLLRLMKRDVEATHIENRVSILLSDPEQRRWKPNLTRELWAGKVAPGPGMGATDLGPSEDRLRQTQASRLAWRWSIIGAAIMLLIFYFLMLMKIISAPWMGQ